MKTLFVCGSSFACLFFVIATDNLGQNRPVPNLIVPFSTSTLGFGFQAARPLQSNIAAQQAKINDDLKPFKYYPLIQLIIGDKF